MKSLSNQKGQLVVEAVLMMALFLGLTITATNYLKKSQLAMKLTSEPWIKLSGMIECGSWQTCQGVKGVHPASRDRNLSLRVEE